VSGYVALFRAGLRRQATYRAALATGLAANLFFGVFRSAIFIGLYRHVQSANGLQLADTLTYVWILQVLFGVIISSWMWEFPENVRSGNFVVDLLRPGDPFLRLLAVDVGRSAYVLVFRGLPQLVLPALVLDLNLPTSPLGILALAVSLCLCLVAGFEMRFLFGSAAFWTADYRGWWNVLFSVVWLVAGFVVPVEFFPGLFRDIASHNPLSALLVLPVRVATDRGAASAVLEQLAWVLVVGAGCLLLMRTAERRVVVHGG
jgi:ABC-2 type transport system permease protein